MKLLKVNLQEDFNRFIRVGISTNLPPTTNLSNSGDVQMLSIISLLIF